ncbi:hypothetical protein HAP94_11010 [Acidithiobacillus ferrivorans]|nr:hypothetical protein [Acidithiobacillus ferrivorans]
MDSTITRDEVIRIASDYFKLTRGLLVTDNYYKERFFVLFVSTYFFSAYSVFLSAATERSAWTIFIARLLFFAGIALTLYIVHMLFWYDKIYSDLASVKYHKGVAPQLRKDDILIFAIGEHDKNNLLKAVDDVLFRRPFMQNFSGKFTALLLTILILPILYAEFISLTFDTSIFFWVSSLFAALGFFIVVMSFAIRTCSWVIRDNTVTHLFIPLYVLRDDLTDLLRKKAFTRISR